MGFIMKTIPFAGGIFADKNGKSSYDYYAYFEEKDAGKLKEKYLTPEDAYKDGCKFIHQYRDGMSIFSVVEGVNPEMVKKLWDYPKNEEAANSIYVNYKYTSPSQKEALKWFSKNLSFISSRYGINVHLTKLDNEYINE